MGGDRGGLMRADWGTWRPEEDGGGSEASLALQWAAPALPLGCQAEL